jgi:hypothetical protein
MDSASFMIKTMTSESGGLWFIVYHSSDREESSYTSSKRQRVGCQRLLNHSLALRACINSQPRQRTDENHGIPSADRSNSTGTQCREQFLTDYEQLRRH